VSDVKKCSGSRGGAGGGSKLPTWAGFDLEPTRGNTANTRTNTNSYNMSIHHVGRAQNKIRGYDSQNALLG
jgi:hypothetical protein